MKKVVLTVLVMIALGVFAEMHLAHENELLGYREGCRDVIKTASNAATFPDQVIDEYCAKLSQRYVNK